MTKTVKDILREAHGIKYQGDIASELLRKLSIEITEAYEKELAEKDEEIKLLKIRIKIENDGSCELFEKGHKLQKENEELKKLKVEECFLLNKSQQIKIKNLEKEIEKLKQSQLFKKDFDKGRRCGEGHMIDVKCDFCLISYRLNNNSKYDKLPSKDVK